jgi:hypothetical protein
VIVSEAVWDLHARDLPAQFGLDANSALEATRLMYVGGGLVGVWYQCTPPNGCGAGRIYGLPGRGRRQRQPPRRNTMTAIHAAFNRHQIGCATPPPVNSGCGRPGRGARADGHRAGQAVALSWTAVPATRYAVYRADGVRGCASAR